MGCTKHELFLTNICNNCKVNFERIVENGMKLAEKEVKQNERKNKRIK